MMVATTMMMAMLYVCDMMAMTMMMMLHVGDRKLMDLGGGRLLLATLLVWGYSM